MNGYAQTHIASAVTLAAFALAFGAREPQPDQRLKNAFRRPELNGWIFVHLEGTPAQIGYQHGYLLANEIDDAGKRWNCHWFTIRNPGHSGAAAKRFCGRRVPAEYQAELKGIVEGARAKGVKIDIWDLTAMNAWLELSPYYVNWYDKSHKQPAPEHCSAFVATGSYTKDGRPVIAHNNWTDYLTGSRWNIIFDITPAAGYRFIMDGMPGLIHSGDDFGVNSAGIMITETTISQFHGFDPNGIPEFARARKGMQYSASIDDYARDHEGRQ